MLACVCLVTVATLPMNTFNGTAAHVPVKASLLVLAFHSFVLILF